MNKNQIMRQELEKIKTNRLNAELKAKRILLIARGEPEYNEIDTKIRQLKLKITKEDNPQKTAPLLKELQQLNNEANKVLVKIGIDPKLLIPRYNCKKCNDLGILNGKPCVCLQNAIQNVLITQSGITNHLKFSFDDCDETIIKENKSLEKAYKIAKKYIDEFPKFQYQNLIFIGDVGVGKTFLLECMANELLKRSHYVVFSTAFDINKTMINAFNVSYNERETMLAPFFESELLIIDDLGSEPIIRNTTLSNLFTIINERQRLNLPTIISTNLNIEDIQERYGDRIMSRLFNKRICLAIPFTGKDLRMNK